MVYKDFETPLLTTGGLVTAFYQFLEGDFFNVFLGTLVTISVLLLNGVKIYIHIKKIRKDEKDK